MTRRIQTRLSLRQAYNQRREHFMRVIPSFLLAGVLATSGACGGDSGTGPGPTYDSIAGSYAGAMVGLSQGIAMDATFSLTVSQNGGSAAGTWGLSGTLTDGIDVVDVAGTGTLSGTIAAGNNPSVNITVRSPGCPNYQAQFSGAYDSTNRRLTLTGPVEFFADGTCTVVLSYPITFILAR